MAGLQGFACHLPAIGCIYQHLNWNADRYIRHLPFLSETTVSDWMIVSGQCIKLNLLVGTIMPANIAVHMDRPSATSSKMQLMGQTQAAVGSAAVEKTCVITKRLISLKPLMLTAIVYQKGPLPMSVLQPTWTLLNRTNYFNIAEKEVTVSQKILG